MENQGYFEKKKINAKIVKRVSVIALLVNIILTALKLTIGAAFFNISVLSDAVHSLSDVGTTLLVLLAVAVSKPEADKKHNYGHERVEPLLVLLFAIILGAVGIMLVWQGIKGILSPKAVIFNYYLLSVTVCSIAVKEAMYWYTIHYARKTGSNMLKADAWHHRSDSLSSVAVLVGLICGIFIKTDLAESIAVLLVAALIMKVAVDICRSSVNQLIDKAVDEKTETELKRIVEETEDVKGIDSFRTRLFGNAIYADIEIRVSPALSITESHEIAERVHERLESQDKYPVKHCNIHVNPDNAVAADEESESVEG